MADQRAGGGERRVVVVINGSAGKGDTGAAFRAPLFVSSVERDLRIRTPQ